MPSMSLNIDAAQLLKLAREIEDEIRSEVIDSITISPDNDLRISMSFVGGGIDFDHPTGRPLYVCCSTKLNGRKFFVKVKTDITSESYVKREITDSEILGIGDRILEELTEAIVKECRVVLQDAIRKFYESKAEGEKDDER